MENLIKKSISEFERVRARYKTEEWTDFERKWLRKYVTNNLKSKFVNIESFYIEIQSVGVFLEIVKLEDEIYTANHNDVLYTIDSFYGVQLFFKDYFYLSGVKLYRSPIKQLENILSFKDLDKINEFNNYVDKLFVLNERFSFDKVKEKINDIIFKLEEIPEKYKPALFKKALIALISIYSLVHVKKAIDSIDIEDPIIAEIVDDMIYVDDEENISKASIEIGYDFNKRKDPTKMKLSQKGWDHIKWEEGDPKKKGEPVLKAYKLGDGKITVGWGHAEPIRKSKFKLGQIITKEKAEELLKEDLKKAADGVRRMFQQWKEEGIEVRITQDQFDVLVSLAFNCGVSGLRNSEIVNKLKEGRLKDAGEEIKDFKVGNWEGLKDRREKEHELWNS